MSTISINSRRVVDQLRGGLYLLPPGIGCNYMVCRVVVLSDIGVYRQLRVPFLFVKICLSRVRRESRSL